MSRGKFVVIEGVDCVGKSSVIKAALKKASSLDVVGNRGFRRESLWGKMINKYPQSSLYYLDFALNTRYKIEPMLDEGVIVLQDRYVQTVDTYAPDCEWEHNQKAREDMSHLFLKPDLYVQITCDEDEMFKRLREGDDQGSYHRSLIENPQLVYDRLDRYRRVYESLTCRKRVLDTTNRSAEHVACDLIEMIFS